MPWSPVNNESSAFTSFLGKIGEVISIFSFPRHLNCVTNEHSGSVLVRETDAYLLGVGLTQVNSPSIFHGRPSHEEFKVEINDLNRPCLTGQAGWCPNLVCPETKFL